MSYLTVAKVKARVGGEENYFQLTDDDGDGTPDPAVESWALNLADSIANGYAARAGYTIPLASTDSSLLEPFLLDVVNFKLKSRGNRVAGDLDEELYKDAMATFRELASGDFTLPSSSAGETGGFANLDFDGNEQVLTRSRLGNF
jgi:phage gp36-like protein